MAELKEFTVQKRENFGKGFNRRLRVKGLVPGIFYSRDGKNTPIQVNLKSLEKMFAQVGRTTVFNLAIEGDGKHPALFWAAKRDPYKNAFMHIDFYGVDLERPVKVVVPVVFTGTACGTKVGGVLETYRDQLTLLAKPLDMPSRVVIDVTNLDINHTIQIADLKLPENVSAVYDINYAVVAVLPPSEAENEEDGDTPATPAA